MKLTIAQVVLEDATFEHRRDYLSLPQNTAVAQSQVTFTTEVGRADQNPNGAAYVRLAAKSAEDAIYLFDISYVVFYLMEWEEGETVPDDLDRRLMITGSTMLFPFVREVMANLSGRGKFGPTWLAPINFNDLVTGKPPEVAASR